MAKAKYGAKAKFIRENPTASPEDLVQLGKKKGLKLTAEYVHNVRSKDRESSPRSRSGSRRRRRTSTRSQPTVLSSLSKEEKELVRAATQIGLSRSRELMQAVEEFATAV